MVQPYNRNLAELKRKQQVYILERKLSRLYCFVKNKIKKTVAFEKTLMLGKIEGRRRRG